MDRDVRMHDDQLQVDVRIVRGLVDDRFPEWRDEPIREVVSDATVNAIFRIGSGFAARFPLRPTAAGALAAEAAAATAFAEHCPFPTPRIVAVVPAEHGSPTGWTVQTWLPGAVATPRGLAGSFALADDLARLIAALRGADTSGRRFSGDGRGGDLRSSDAWVETCFQRSVGLVDVPRLRPLWQRFRVLPATGPDRLTHGDLTPPNLLVDGDRLVGVLDCGGSGPADPALDLIGAWHLLDRPAREHLRASLRCTPTEWRRGAAWALEQSMGIVWYYDRTNPGMAALGRSTLERIAADPDL